MPNTLEQAHALMADAKRQIVEGFQSGDHVVIIQVGYKDAEYPEEYVFNTSDSACQFLDYLVNTGRTAGRANLEVEIDLREVLKPDYAIQRLETEFPKPVPDTELERSYKHLRMLKQRIIDRLVEGQLVKIGLNLAYADDSYETYTFIEVGPACQFMDHLLASDKMADMEVEVRFEAIDQFLTSKQAIHRFEVEFPSS